MGEDKRKSKRTDIDVTIKINNIKSKHPEDAKKLDVKVVNISEDGIAFKTDEVLTIDSIYDTIMYLANGEKFAAVIEIVRIVKESPEDKDSIYGCRFVGINPEDRFRIDVYQALCEYNRL